MRFQRYVALGDSSTEGLDDPDGTGGWANRLAERVAANLGVRGARSRTSGAALALRSRPLSPAWSADDRAPKRPAPITPP